MEKQFNARYNRVAVLLHWSIALIILALLGMGLWMTGTFDAVLGNGNADPMLKFRVYQWHKSLGVILLLLVSFRIFWRLTHRAPPENASFPAWERHAAALGHIALYILMLALPVTGWLMVSSSPLGLPTIVFGWFEWPHLPISSSEEISSIFAGAHKYLAYGIIVMIALHVGAVFKHLLIDRINILPRMWLLPTKSPKTGE